MSKPNPVGLGTEVHISPKPVLGIVLALGCLLLLAAEIRGYPWETVNRVASLCLLLSGLLVLVGNRWEPDLGGDPAGNSPMPL